MWERGESEGKKKRGRNFTVKKYGRGESKIKKRGRERGKENPEEGKTDRGEMESKEGQCKHGREGKEEEKFVWEQRE